MLPQSLMGIYEMKKREHNQSYITECTRPDDHVGGGKVNYSPVKNTYDALWEEYRTANDSIALINVTRRILEYYYLQICGYSSGDLRTDLLEKNSHRFEAMLPDGSLDKTDYNVAAAMIAVLNIGARGFNDGLFFDASAIELQQIREHVRILDNLLRWKSERTLGNRRRRNGRIQEEIR